MAEEELHELGQQLHRQPQTPQETPLQRFYYLFCLTATIQGRLAYCLMSIHVVHPNLFPRVFDINPGSVLFANMIYGLLILIFTRPTLSLFSTALRISISVTWSLMFNYSTMLFYDWLNEKLSARPIILTITAFISARFFLYNLIIFLLNTDQLILLHMTRRPMPMPPAPEHI